MKARDEPDDLLAIGRLEDPEKCRMDFRPVSIEDFPKLVRLSYAGEVALEIKVKMKDCSSAQGLAKLYTRQRNDRLACLAVNCAWTASTKSCSRGDDQPTVVYTSSTSMSSGVNKVEWNPLGSTTQIIYPSSAESVEVTVISRSKTMKHRLPMRENVARAHHACPKKHARCTTNVATLGTRNLPI